MSDLDAPRCDQNVPGAVFSSTETTDPIVVMPAVEGTASGSRTDAPDSVGEVDAGDGSVVWMPFRALYNVAAGAASMIWSPSNAPTTDSIAADFVALSPPNVVVDSPSDDVDDIERDQDESRDDGAQTQSNALPGDEPDRDCGLQAAELARSGDAHESNHPTCWSSTSTACAPNDVVPDDALSLAMTEERADGAQSVMAGTSASDMDGVWITMIETKTKKKTHTIRCKREPQPNGWIAYHMTCTDTRRVRNPEWHGRSAARGPMGPRWPGDTRDQRYVRKTDDREATLCLPGTAPWPTLDVVEKALGAAAGAT